MTVAPVDCDQRPQEHQHIDPVGLHTTCPAIDLQWPDREPGRTPARMLRDGFCLARSLKTEKIDCHQAVGGLIEHDRSPVEKNTARLRDHPPAVLIALS